MAIRGRAWKYGSNVDTDVIIAGRYCHITDKSELAKHCLEDLDKDFVKNIKTGDIIVAGTNFGCGSSREIAPVAIKESGVSCVIAKNFARIFYRNSINIGLPIFESPEAVDNINKGDEVEVDIATGAIKNVTNGKEAKAMPFPDFIQQIIKRGGLMAYLKEKLKDGQKV